MAKIQIADLAQVENQFDELSDLELEVVGGSWLSKFLKKLRIKSVSISFGSGGFSGSIGF
ncbi:hypothetical protein H6F39_15900 [Anabaena sp. FACHB-1250]|uniref:hypothetical protein n=1 Tax=Anabaena sp. FACHB-1250 TaxID=2692770 RepID=UPI00168190FA|nr:hypothetical protein [Anabaena sp. FACHB-1250]MBD2142807.1 hypothetical protein [Anabaena sp. FACHB-1250]